MNYGPYAAGAASQATMALRPDQVASLIALARERVAFMVEQRDVVAEGLAEIAVAHEAIIAHYEAEISRELDLIARMGAFASGARMVPDAAPLASYGPTYAEIEAPAYVAGNGQISALQAQEVAQRQAILGAFSSPADLRPTPAFGGRSKREVVESALPVPQTKVQVVHYEAGEELPAEALPGHMDRDPRTATELAALRLAEEAKSAAQQPVTVDGALTAAEIVGQPFSPVAVEGALDMADIVPQESGLRASGQNGAAPQNGVAPQTETVAAEAAG